MSISRISTSSLVALLLASMAWVAVAQNKRDISTAKPADGKDAALRDLARVVAVHEVHKLHWTILETSREFKPVIEQLSDELVPEELSLRWKVNVIPTRKVKEREMVLDDFERLAVAAIQGGEDEASLIGGESVVRFARAIRAKTGCLACHQTRADGEPVMEKDILGIVTLKMYSHDENP